MKTHTLLGIMVCVASLSAAGCTADRGGMRTGPQDAPQDTDVARIICFYPANMWRSFDSAGNVDPEGFEFVMYLLSRKTYRGIWVEGTFRIQLYRVIDDPDAERSRELVFTTEAPMSQIPRREAGRFGEGYQPSVYWGDLDVLGEKVHIVVQYESPTGRIVQSQTHAAKVPVGKD